MSMNKRRVTFTMPHDLYGRVAASAEKNERDVSSEICYRLKLSLAGESEIKATGIEVERLNERSEHKRSA